LIVLIVAVQLVLAVAVVVLFAMFGQLAARVPAAADASGTAEPILSLHVGRSAGFWPVSLAPLPPPGSFGALIVLSSSCTSCVKVAGQLPTLPSQVAADLLGVVVTGPSGEAAQAFADANLTGALPLFVDGGGDWVTGEFGLQASPSYLIFEGSELRSGYVFDQLNALSGLLPADRSVAT
jgi:hypothetical protein